MDPSLNKRRHRPPASRYQDRSLQSTGKKKNEMKDIKNLWGIKNKKCSV